MISSKPPTDGHIGPTGARTLLRPSRAEQMGQPTLFGKRGECIGMKSVVVADASNPYTRSVFLSFPSKCQSRGACFLVSGWKNCTNAQPKPRNALSSDGQKRVGMAETGAA